MTTTMASQSAGTVDLGSPVRNRYFYGKLLDVFHFELEQNYFNNKRRLLNRIVTGYGVICGLNVTLGSDGQSVVVSPGVAIDKCGREIIVCQPSDPIPLHAPTPAPPPPAPAPAVSAAAAASASTGTGTANPASTPAPVVTPMPASTTMANSDCSDTGNYCHLCICYHECPTDPSPTLGGDCDCEPACTPGSIREKYSLKIQNGKVCPPSMTSPLVINGTLQYSAMANYITGLNCLAPTGDCCIPLANITIPVSPATYNGNSIDIGIRPIVYTNDLLYELLLAWTNQGTAAVRGTK